MVKSNKTSNNNSPILNTPFEEPKQHYASSPDGSLNYQDIREGRRPFSPNVQEIPVQGAKQTEMWEAHEVAGEYLSHKVNILRKEIEEWRSQGYPQTTRVTKDLLNHWFDNPDKSYTKNLFFAQREAIETAIFLNEIAPKFSNASQNILEQLVDANNVHETDDAFNMPRRAFKMATGTGKTVVMGALILYHFLNRDTYPNDTRFVDFFLVVTPSITIKDRLQDLYVDTETRNPRDAKDVYHERDLIPLKYENELHKLNAKIEITNYHAFNQKQYQGNKKSPLDGKKGHEKEGKETEAEMVNRVTEKFKKNRRLLIINDEAHHCYLPKEKGKNTEESNTKDENERAALWATGLAAVCRHYKVGSVYDMSATPYFLNGSGYPPYTLFPWIVSDFSLIEAMESGLVKIPFLPHSDDTQNLTEPVLKDIYGNLGQNDLPKKGRTKEKLTGQPNLPRLVKNALEQIVRNYEKEYNDFNDLFDRPPVFIVVCNNTNTSSEVFRYLAGYQEKDENGEVFNINGQYDIFSNYNPATRTPYNSPRTLLVDSQALDEGQQIDANFKKQFEDEIENLKQEYRKKYPGSNTEKIDDATLLREVVNNVGEPGSVGKDIRCVVSVSMLTEGWDANTVTHIMGLRAFGSQLLCEQVAGRALRRVNYQIDKDGKFPPEYAQIIGIPFNMYQKGGKTTGGDPPETTVIKALPEREEDLEITFPKVLGYREEVIDDELGADFSNVEDFELDGSTDPTKTKMLTAFSDQADELSLEALREVREQHIIYAITKDLIYHYFSNEENSNKISNFNQLKDVVEKWYNNKLKCLGDTFPQMLLYEDGKIIAKHVKRGIFSGEERENRMLPVFGSYGKTGSTKYVSGQTTKEVYPTGKSHVNYVVADSEWEKIAAKALEEDEQVKAYVKNDYLGFAIPYTQHGYDRQYYPDFIAIIELSSGDKIKLIIEVTGMNKDKAVKKWYVENYWLPAVNNVQEKNGFYEWHFIEVSEDIRPFKNELREKIQSIESALANA
jgi:type III restriction enzyme